MMSYFNHKEEFKQYAMDHTREMDINFLDEITYSVNATEIISGPDIIPIPPMVEMVQSEVEYWDMDSVSAIMNANSGNVWVLNFASYKNPGGMFMEGSSAQEESLCRESFLYNVLSDKRFKEYYTWNRSNLNRGLYKNRMLISPNIRFMRYHLGGIGGIDSAKAHIITCAAPNNSVGLRYGRFTQEENNTALINRIRFILSVLGDGRISKNDTVILGAFGCGVFRQNPEMVSQQWVQNLYLLKKECKVIFAVPSKFRDSIWFSDIPNKFKTDNTIRNNLLEKYSKKG